MKFVGFLSDFARQEIEALRSEIETRELNEIERKFNQRLLKEKTDLIAKFIGYFYRALSDNQKVKYRGNLKAVLEEQLKSDVKLKKAHRGITPEEREEIRKNWVDILTEAKKEIEEDPKAEYIFFKREHPWSPLDVKKITKDNLNEYMKWFQNTYNEELGAEG